MTRWTKERIIDALRTWAEETGAAPLAADWAHASAEHPARSTVTTRFGSWATALDAAGVVRASNGRGGRGFGRFGAGAILDLIDEWAQQHGHPPRVIDWTPALAELRGQPDIAQRFRDAHGKWPWARRVTDVFGSWNEALAAAQERTTQSGLKRSAPRPKVSAPGSHTTAWTREECTSAILAFHEANGRGPRSREWDAADPSGTRPTRRTVVRLFGSMRAGVAAARIDASYLTAGAPRRGREHSG